MLKKSLLAALSILIGAGTYSNTAFAQTYVVPNTQELTSVLNAIKSFNPFLKNLKASNLTKKGNYWEANASVGNQRATAIVYKQTGKNILNLALISPSVKLGNLIPIANKGELGKIMLKNVTTIFVSPNSPLTNKQGSTEVAKLPTPVANALKAANASMKTVTLPTGMFSINQFQPGSNKFINDVFKQIGLGSPVVSFISLDAGNYKNLASGKAGLTLSIMLNKNNGIARLIDQTKILKSPSNAQPVLSLSTSTAGGSVGIAYKAPYKVLGKGPIDTTLSFKYAKAKVSGTLTVGLGDMTNPTIVPKAIELKGVAMRDVKVNIGLEPGPKGLEISAGIEMKDMRVRNRTTYAPVRLQLAMTPAGPSGALIEIKSNNTIDLAAIVDLAGIAMNAHPGSKIVPSWAKGDIAGKLQLDKLPSIGIKKPDIYLATPGQDKSSHLADLHGIAGAGVRVRGDLVAFDKTLAKADLNLNIVDGLKSSSSVKPFKAGPLALEKATFDLKAGPKDFPYFKVHGKITFEGVTFSESELRFSKSGFKWVQDQGCVPMMMKISIETRGFKPTSGGIKPSGCAERIAKEVAKVTVVAANEVAKGTTKAANEVANAGKSAGKWVVGAAGEAEKFFKDVGCGAEDFFTGGGCSSRKKRARDRESKKKRDAALAKAAAYRKVVGPAHCGCRWYWNHQYKNCWPGPEYKMLVYVNEGAKKSRCMTIAGGNKKDNAAMDLWKCAARWNQQFRAVPASKDSKDFVIQNAWNKCVQANVSKTKVNGAPIVITKCNSTAANQKWRLVGSRIVGYQGLCLRAKSGSKNGSKLILANCDTDLKIQDLESAIVALSGQLDKSKRDYRIQLEKLKSNYGSQLFGQTTFSNMIRKLQHAHQRALVKIIQSLENKKVELRYRQEERRNPNKTPPLEWITMEPSHNTAKTYHAAYKIPSHGKLKMGQYCLDNVDSYLPKNQPRLVDCKHKSSMIFAFGNISGKYVSIVNRRSRMCLDINGNSTGNDASIIEWPCHYGSNQQWMAITPGDKTTDANTFKGPFLLKSRRSGKCISPVHMKMEFVGGKPRFTAKREIGPTAWFVQWPCNSNDRNQQFTLLPQ